MKKNLITKALVFPLLFCTGILLLKSCKKNDAASYETDAIAQFTRHVKTSNAALEKVIADVKIQLGQKDFSADFVKWHGQPLWDKALTLQKNSASFILLIPTQKNSNIETFIGVRLKDGKFAYEMHRRSAMDKKIAEPSWMKINNGFRQNILAYFNNSILGKVDNTDIPPSVYATKSSAASNSQQPDNYIQLCFNSGYCGPDACPPGAPEGGVCCITRVVCINVWYNGDGGPGIDPDPGPGGGGGNPPPDPCPTANWYTQNPTPPGGGGGIGGGDGDPCNFGDPEDNLEAVAFICKSSFKFKKFVEPENGIGGWQVAGTKKIHMNIIDLVSRRVVPLYLPTIYFGLPVFRSNGEYYSTSTAAGIAADAVEYGETKVMEYYHSIGGNLDAVGMTLYYRQKINAYMQTKGGSASLYSGTNIDVTDLGEATYSWP